MTYSKQQDNKVNIKWYHICDEDPWIRIGEFVKTHIGYQSGKDGKYLFFSSDKQQLIDLIESKINNYGFTTAKIIDYPKGKDYVACLFWYNDERKYELANRWSNVKGIKYRYYKSNADTLNGKYSQQFLRSVV